MQAFFSLKIAPIFSSLSLQKILPRLMVAANGLRVEFFSPAAPKP